MLCLLSVFDFARQQFMCINLKADSCIFARACLEPTVDPITQEDDLNHVKQRSYRFLVFWKLTGRWTISRVTILYPLSGSGLRAAFQDQASAHRYFVRRQQSVLNLTNLLCLI